MFTQVVNKVPPFFSSQNQERFQLSAYMIKGEKKSKYEIRQMPTRGRLLQFQHRLWYRATGSKVAKKRRCLHAAGKVASQEEKMFTEEI